MSAAIFAATRRSSCSWVDAIMEGDVGWKEGKGYIFEVSNTLIKLIKSMHSPNVFLMFGY